MCGGVGARSSCGITNSQSWDRTLSHFAEEEAETPEKLENFTPLQVPRPELKYKPRSAYSKPPSELHPAELAAGLSGRVLTESSSKQDTLPFTCIQVPQHLSGSKTFTSNCSLFCFPAADVTGRLTPHFNLSAKKPIKLLSALVKKKRSIYKESASQSLFCNC